MQDLVEEILEWFLKNHTKKTPQQYATVDSRWPTARFWLDTELLAQCRRLARRDAVSQRRLLATALTLYSQQFIPPAFKTFRDRTSQQVELLYAKSRTRSNKR